MLAPEVLHMPPPKSFDFQLNNDINISKYINQQYFNHSVSLILPDILHLPESIIDVLSVDTQYYHVASLPAFELVDSQFIRMFVKAGCITLHSINTRLDHDNCLAILPSGVLILSLTADTFQKLGVEGKASEFVNGRFVIKLNLKSEKFVFGCKSYDRLVERLKSLTELTFDVIMAWEPSQSDVCPSSIAAWFNDASYLTTVCSNRFERKTLYDMKAPDYDDNDFMDVLEWVGMALLECDMVPADPWFSSYCVPSPNTSFGQVLSLNWTGLLTSTKVNEAAKKLKDWLDGRGSGTWVAMIVHGLDDSVTTHGEKEHHFYVQGEYNISIIMNPAKPSTALVHIASHKSPTGRKRSS